MIKNKEYYKCEHERGRKSALFLKQYKTYSVVYLIIILFYLLRPALPYLEYAINKDYISENLCIKKNVPGSSCHGKCYLDKQLKKSIEPANTGKNNSNRYIQDKITDDHLKSEACLTESYAKSISVMGCYRSGFTDSFPSVIFIPPRF